MIVFLFQACTKYRVYWGDLAVRRRLGLHFMLTAESRICPLNRSPVMTERERRDVFGKKNKKHPTCREPERQAASAAALPGPDQKSPELVSLPCHAATTTNITPLRRHLSSQYTGRGARNEAFDGLDQWAFYSILTRKSPPGFLV